VIFAIVLGCNKSWGVVTYTIYISPRFCSKTISVTTGSTFDIIV